MHRDLWMRYKDLSDEEKMKFFDQNTAFAKTVPSFSESADKMEIKIEAEIIDDVKKTLFCTDDTKYGFYNLVTALLCRLNPPS